MLVSPKVRGLVVVLGLRGEILGIWLVVYGLFTGGDENILSLLMMDQDWSMGGLVGWFLIEVLARGPLSSGRGSC